MGVKFFIGIGPNSTVDTKKNNKCVPTLTKIIITEITIHKNLKNKI